MLPNGPRISYGNMTPEKARQLIAAYAKNGDLQPNWALGRFHSEELVSTGEVRTYPEQSCGLKGVPRWSALDF